MSHDELFVGPLGAKLVEQGLGRKMAVAILKIVRLDFALSDQPAGSRETNSQGLVEWAFGDRKRVQLGKAPPDRRGE